MNKVPPKATLLAILVSAGCFSGIGSAEESFVPIATETHRPVDRPPFPDTWHPGARPQPVPPEATEELLDDFGFEAEPPDSIVSIVQDGSSGLSAPAVTAATVEPVSATCVAIPSAWA